MGVSRPKYWGGANQQHFFFLETDNVGENGLFLPSIITVRRRRDHFSFLILKLAKICYSCDLK